MIKYIQVNHNGLYIHYEIHDDEISQKLSSETKIARIVWAVNYNMIVEIAGMLYNNTIIVNHSRYEISLYNIVSKKWCEISFTKFGEIENISQWL